MVKRELAILLIVVCLSGVANSQETARLSQEQINTIAQSVVLVLVPAGRDSYVQGSGTIVSADGQICTSRHLIEGATEFSIYMLDDLREPAVHRYNAALVGVSDEVDFAILQIDSDADGRSLDRSMLDLPFVPIGAEEAQIGQPIHIFGYPRIGDGYIVATSGEITTVQNGTIGASRMPVWYQTDTQISPGSSGGLVVDMRGEMIGIPTAVKIEERTGGRLGGILPMPAIHAASISRPVRKIVVATDATWPPMEFVNAQRQIVGYDIDLIGAIAAAAGFEVELRNAAWDGIFAGLDTGDYDAVISAVSITEDRRRTMDFSQPYINAGAVLIVRQDVLGVTELSDLSGKTVGAQTGTTEAFEVGVADGVALAPYDDFDLAIEDLLDGRIDGVVANTALAADFVLRFNSYERTLKIVGEPITEEYCAVAVKKGNNRVLDLINKGLAAVLASDIPEQLADKWLR